MKETTKAYQRRKFEPIWNDVFRGDGIDIGAGDDPFLVPWFANVTSVKTFDLHDGDANRVTVFVKDQFDFVHSSNCLEHMFTPKDALQDWWKLVKPNGHLVFTVPDEDLYEQGVFPSRWNADHKWTFTMYKKFSWSRRSINVMELLTSLPNCIVRRIQLADTNYDRSIKNIDQTYVGNAEAFIEVILKKV